MVDVLLVRSGTPRDAPSLHGDERPTSCAGSRGTTPLAARRPLGPLCDRSMSAVTGRPVRFYSAPPGCDVSSGDSPVMAGSVPVTPGYAYPATDMRKGPTSMT